MQKSSFPKETDSANLFFLLVDELDGGPVSYD